MATGRPDGSGGCGRGLRRAPAMLAWLVAWAPLRAGNLPLDRVDDAKSTGSKAEGEKTG
ncbi:MAG: hypothetical protein ACKVT1_15995 [Dehalococcoidia bacterium]